MHDTQPHNVVNFTSENHVKNGIKIVDFS